MSQKALLVFVSGYPGSGKTLFVDSLLKALRLSLENRVCKFSEKRLPWKSRLLNLGWVCVRHGWFLVCVTMLLQSVKGTMNVRTFPQTLKDAVRLTSSHSAYQSLLQDPPTQIFLIDEPPWHKLWLKIFPNFLKGPWIGIFNYVMQLMLTNKHADVSSVFIQLSAPVDLSLERIRGRDNPGSRFNKKMDDHFLNILKNDQIYPLIFKQIKQKAKDGSLLIENAHLYTCENISKLILENTYYLG